MLNILSLIYEIERKIARDGLRGYPLGQIRKAVELTQFSGLDQRISELRKKS